MGRFGSESIRVHCHDSHHPDVVAFLGLLRFACCCDLVCRSSWYHGMHVQSHMHMVYISRGQNTVCAGYIGCKYTTGYSERELDVR